MSTCNFTNDDLLGIIALNSIDYEAEYRASEGIEDDDVSYIFEWYYKDWDETLQDLNSSLYYMSLQLEPGYYYGATLKIEGNNIDTYDLKQILAVRNNKDQLAAVCKDMELDHYYGYKPSKIVSEFKTVVDWINARIKTTELLNLGITAIFSNGEAVYHLKNQLLEV